MDYKHHLLLYQPITPLHIGCGQDVGVVDLPVIRERTTGYPFIPGSGIRGRLRETFERKAEGFVARLFGSEAAEADEEKRRAGCVAVHDARLLLFPVRSDVAPFLWITCPAVLRRFSRDAQAFLTSANSWRADPEAEPENDVLRMPNQANKVHLEEFELDRQSSDAGLTNLAEKLAPLLGQADLAKRVALVSDSTFHYFATHATQVIQHNRLTSAKTVASGQLFSVEAVPPEAIFYGFLGATDERLRQGDDAQAESGERLGHEKVLQKLAKILVPQGQTGYLQLGGDEGTGLGVTRLAWASEIIRKKAEEPGDGHAS
jgi:CRISPR-associated protein Cmr4